MDKFDRLNAAQKALRSYSEAHTEEEPTAEDEADGLVLATQIAVENHDSEQLQDIVDALSGDDVEDRAYTDGKILMPSKKNPAIKRWVRAAAAKKIAGDAGHQYLWGGALSGALHRAQNRGQGIGREDSALHASHYLKHHHDFVEKTAQAHGLRKQTVAVALAHHAHIEIAKQKKKNSGGAFHNSGISNKDFHRSLGNQAKTSFAHGLAARQKTP